MSTHDDSPIHWQYRTYQLKDRDSLPSLTNSENTVDEYPVSETPCHHCSLFDPATYLVGVHTSSVFSKDRVLYRGQ